MKRLEFSSDDIDQLAEILNIPLEGMDTYTLEVSPAECGPFVCEFKGVLAPPKAMLPELTLSADIEPEEVERTPLIHASHQRYSRRLHIPGSAPPRSTSILVPINPEGIRSRGQLARFGEALVIGPGQELSFHTPAGLDYVECHIEPTIVEEIEEALGAPIVPGSRPIGARERSCFIAAVEAWLEEPDPNGFVETRGLARGANEVIEAATRVFASYQVSEEGSRPPPPTRRRVARVVRDYLAAQLHRPVATFELCQVAGASLRTVENAFREQTGATPIAYHRLSRLTHIHRALKRSHPEETSVSDTARRFGFSHLGRFAFEYKRQFGESPSTTLANDAARPSLLRVRRSEPRARFG